MTYESDKTDLPFEVKVHYTPHLAPGSTRLDALVEMECRRELSIAAPIQRAEVFVVDVSGSMEWASENEISDQQAAPGESKLDYAKIALENLLNNHSLDENTQIAIVAFHAAGRVIFSLAPATPDNKQKAIEAVRNLSTRGSTGTAISTGLRCAQRELAKLDSNCSKHIILMTDGQNVSEGSIALQGAVGDLAESLPQKGLDIRGLGSQWDFAELQRVSTRFGTQPELIRKGSHIESNFNHILGTSLKRNITGVSLRIRTMAGVDVKSIEQVYPEILKTLKRLPNPDARTWEYETGAWGTDERRSFVLALQLPEKDVGTTMKLATISIALGGVGEPLNDTDWRVLATWTKDEDSYMRINENLAHYKGQVELGELMQKGLEARRQGADEVAKGYYSKAVKLAKDDEEATARLKLQVEIIDADTGTVKLKPRDAAAELDMSGFSSRTRAKRE